MSTRPRVAIIGAGFGGLYAAKALRRVPVDITLIDQHNYHTFQPLLYQVATAALEPENVAYTVRGIFRNQKNIIFRHGTVIGIDWRDNTIALADGGSVGFDYVITAAGAIYADFGIPGVKKYGIFLKSLTEAVNMRSHIIRQFERASADPSCIDQGVLNFVIVGGGPTGVEMAGSLVELFARAIPKDFPDVDVSRARVILLEMLDTLLPPFSEKSRQYTIDVLRRRGVDIRLRNAVAEVRHGEVELKDGEIIPTQTLIWAAGIRATPLAEALGVDLTRGFRVTANRDLSLPAHPHAFVVGDMSGATDNEGKLYPQVAQVAIQQGIHAARQIQRRIDRKEPEPFHYHDKGIMAIIGRNAGLAELSKSYGGLHLRGFMGWLAWLFIHLIYLVGYANRFAALMDWTNSYFTWERRSRLITEMEPSPAEITNRTEKLLPPDKTPATPLEPRETPSPRK